MAIAIGTPENPICSAANVSDATGIALTCTTKQVTLPVLKSATLLVETRNVGITFSATNGTWTVVTAGLYELIATIGAAANSVNAHNNLFQFYKNTTAVGSVSKRVEPAAAVSTGQAGCAALLDLAVGDVITLKADCDNDGDVITVKQCSIIIKRIGPVA